MADPFLTRQAGAEVASAIPALGVYVSIPFCRAKCSYCNFASGAYGKEQIASYVEKVLQEIQSLPKRATQWGADLPRKVDTLYFGGGTPTSLSISRLQTIINVLHDVMGAHSFDEATLECAPGQLDEDVLQALPSLGFNRVSLGVQSFVDQESAAVGRRHTRQIVLDDIHRLRAAGIDEINVDLIAGLPHQTLESWNRSLAEAIATEVPHVSVYMLDVDEDSRLGREILAGGTRYGAAKVPDESAVASMYMEAGRRFQAAGVQQYEISNFARVGHASRHNLKYWTRQPYVGFGLDAHSFLPTRDGNSIRIGTQDNLAAYLGSVDPYSAESMHVVTRNESLEESWFLGLRLVEGVSLASMERRFGVQAVSAMQPILRESEREGLLERVGGRVRLTRRGRLFANDVFSRFLGAVETNASAVS